MDATTSSRGARFRLVLALGALVALGPLTIDMYLPALPSIVTDLGTTEPLVQLTLTGSLLGLGLGQLFVGPYSDAVGRRRPLILGTLLHVVTSLLCAFATDIAALNILRILQGLGAAATTVVAMAMVRDMFEGRRAATMISHLMLVMGVAPILAPSLGSAVLVAGSWRWVFGALAVLGVALIAVAAFAVPETLPAQRRAPRALRPAMSAFRTILRDGEFVALTLVAGLAFGTAFAYVSGAPFVMHDQYHLDDREFGLVFGLGALALVGATQMNPLLLRRFTPARVMFLATIVVIVAGLALVVFPMVQPDALVAFLVPVVFVLAGVALIMPNAAALALSRHGAAAGTAAAVLGAIRFVLGSAVAPLVGVFGNDATATAAVMTGSAAVALLFITTIVRRGRRDPHPVTPVVGMVSSTS